MWRWSSRGEFLPRRPKIAAAFGSLALLKISGRPPRMVLPEIDLSHAAYLERGDVVVALLGDLGKSAVVDDRGAGAVLGRECAALRISASDQLLPAWLEAWTRSEHFKNQVAGHTSGSTMPRLNRRALADFTLPIPSMSYQEELAADVERVDAVLVATREMVRDLEDLRAAEVDLAVARVIEP